MIKIVLNLLVRQHRSAASRKNGIAQREGIAFTRLDAVRQGRYSFYPRPEKHLEGIAFTPDLT